MENRDRENNPHIALAESGPERISSDGRIDPSKVRVLGNRVLVRQLEAKSHHGKIEIVEGARERPQLGEIIALGKGDAEDVPTMKILMGSLEVGSTVAFSKFGGVDFLSMEGETLLVLRVEDILLVLE